MIQTAKFSPASAARTVALLRGRAYPSRSPNDQYSRLSSLLNDAKFSSQIRQTPGLTPLSSTLISRRFLHSTSTCSQQRKEHSHTDQQKSNPHSSESESEANTENKKEGEDESSSQGQKKKDAPPPPPHGDKTPWQVFTETLSSEFKKSKEWEESTKALASSAHHFTESESVKRARAAYETASTTATSTTSSALKSTGRAIGHGAAWTWQTPVVKGLRKGVSATGKGIEKVTRPVRETEAYKTAVGGVKEAIDDGSSSRYGGWVEKEERRRQRQLREENAKAGRSGKVEIMEEDPKYVLIAILLNVLSPFTD
jgi:mitochondrial import inner membrane translocase subunit TIM44